MPVYDDPDYEWKQMVKRNGICDPYEESIREFKEEYERIEKKLKQTGRWIMVKDDIVFLLLMGVLTFIILGSV